MPAPARVLPYVGRAQEGRGDSRVRSDVNRLCADLAPATDTRLLATRRRDAEGGWRRAVRPPSSSFTRTEEEQRNRQGREERKDRRRRE